MSGPVICGIEDVNGAGVARVARDLAERYQLPLLYLHVLDRDADGEQATRMLHEVAGAEMHEILIESGHPADRLIELAGERDASFLVVGNHGPRSSLLGSVSAEVSRRAPCRVIVVPPTVDVAGSALSGAAAS